MRREAVHSIVCYEHWLFWISYPTFKTDLTLRPLSLIPLVIISIIISTSISTSLSTSVFVPFYCFQWYITNQPTVVTAVLSKAACALPHSRQTGSGCKSNLLAGKCVFDFSKVLFFYHCSKMSLQQRNQHVVEAYEKFNISQWGKGADRVSIIFSKLYYLTYT